MGHCLNIITGISSVFPSPFLVNSGSLCLEQTCRNTQSNTADVHNDVDNLTTEKSSVILCENSLMFCYCYQSLLRRVLPVKQLDQWINHLSCVDSRIGMTPVWCVTSVCYWHLVICYHQAPFSWPPIWIVTLTCFHTRSTSLRATWDLAKCPLYSYSVTREYMCLCLNEMQLLVFAW